jgi:glycosyltransferase involved in cell wall biosynthesis
VTKPRICLLTETFHPIVGGGETQAKALAQGLVAQGFDIMILTRRSDASFARDERYGAVTVHRLPPVGPQHLKKWGLMLASLPELIRARRRYDLIFVSGFRVLGISAMIASVLLDKPCILKADSLGEMSGEFFASGLAKLGLRPTSPAVRLFLRARNALLKRADCFVAISSAVTTELIDQGIDPDKIKEIPNSVDVSRFRPVDAQKRRLLRRSLHLPENGTIVIYTGRLVSYKGLPLLLQVWARIRSHHKQAHLVLVGTGGLDIHNCEARLRDYVQSHNLQDSVEFTGAVQNVHEYLQAADIFAFPTEREAFGISLIEAMACGLAVVSTSAGGTQELVKHGQDGLVVETGSVEQLYDALNTLVTDLPLVKHLGRNACQSAQRRFAAESVILEHVELLQRHASLSTCDECRC